MKKMSSLYVSVIPENAANPPNLLNTAILQRKLKEPGHDIFNVRANFFSILEDHSPPSYKLRQN